MGSCVSTNGGVQKPYVRPADCFVTADGSPLTGMAGLRDRIRNTPGVSYSPELEDRQRQQQNSGSVLGISVKALEDVFAAPATAHLAELGVTVEGAPPSLSYSDTDVSVPWIHEHVIKPASLPGQCAFLDLFFGITFSSLAKPAIGEISVFHSYTWKTKWGMTFRTLWDNIALDKRYDTYIWLDLFCQNQHQVGNVQKTFAAAIDKTKTFIFSIPSLQDPKPIGRIWCLFELAYAISKGLEPQLIAWRVGAKELKVLLLKQFDDYLVDVRKAEATKSEDIEVVLNLIQKMLPGGADYVNKVVRERFQVVWRNRLFLAAASCASLEGLKSLIAQGVRVGSTDAHGANALHYIADNKEAAAADCVRYLVAAGANVNAKDWSSTTPLHCAGDAGNRPLWDLLVELGASTTAQNTIGAKPQLWA